MSYDGSGNYSLPPGYFVANGQTIVPSQHNPIFQDVAAALSQVVLRSGVAPMSGNLVMSGNKVTGLALGTAFDDAATVGQAASVVGDGKRSLVTQDSTWLPANSSVYTIASYPELAPGLLPPLADTISWVSNSTGQSNALQGIAQSGSVYVACGIAGTLLRSTDRVSWASISSGTSATLQYITKGSTLWVSIGTLTPSGGGVVSKSSDSLTWSSTNLSPSFVFTELRGLVFDGTNYVVSGYDNTAGTVYKVLYGTDASVWTSVTVTTAGPMAYNGSSRIVMVSQLTGSVISSDNHGVTWTTRVASGFGSVEDVCWDAVNSLFITVGATGLIKTSPDGIAWTTRTSGTTSNLVSVRAGPNGIMAVGSNLSFVLFSTDGVTWSSKASPTTGSRALLADNTAAYHFLYGNTTVMNDGTRTLPTQFQTPNWGDNWWIKAKSV